MSTLVQTTDGDIDLSTGNFSIINDIDQVTAIKLANRFKFFKGEWFRDSRQGVPYYQRVLVKNPDLVSINQLFNRIILQTPNIRSILNSSGVFDKALRKYTFTFRAMTQTGNFIEGGLGSPFIVVYNGKGQS